MCLRVMEWVCGTEVGEALEDVERYAPYSGCGVTWGAECVCASDIADDGVVVGEGDVVSCGDDVVNAGKGGAESVRDYGGWV